MDRSRFRGTFAQTFSLRLHFSLMLLLCILAAAATDLFLLKILDLYSIPTRYALVTCSAYAFLLLTVRLWLTFVLPKPNKQKTDLTDPLDLASTISDLSSEGINSTRSARAYQGGGGRFSGGGASASYGENSPNTKSSFSLADIDAGEATPILFLIGLGIACISALVSLIYLVYSAPLFLADVAFEAALSYGLFKQLTKKVKAAVQEGRPMRTAFKKTLPVFLVLLLSIYMAGLCLGKLFPEARVFSDVFSEESADERQTIREFFN